MFPVELSGCSSCGPRRGSGCSTTAWQRYEPPRIVFARPGPRGASGSEPVRAPLPDVAGAVVDAEAVRRVGVTGAVPSQPSSSVLWVGKVPCQMLQRCSPPGVSSSPHGKRRCSSPPRAAYSHSASVGRRTPGPAAVRARVGPGHVDHRVVRPLVHGGPGPLGPAPVGAVDLAPPRRLRGAPWCRGKSSGRRPAKTNDQPKRSASRDVAGRRHELRELLVRDRQWIDPERLHEHLADGALAIGREAVGVLRSHQEGLATELDELGVDGAHASQSPRSAAIRVRRGELASRSTILITTANGTARMAPTTPSSEPAIRTATIVVNGDSATALR